MGKHTPWPSSRSLGNKKIVDLDKLRELYLAGPDYDWTPFCKRNGFDPKYNRNKWKDRGYDFSDWKKEWLGQQAQLQDEELAPEVLNLRKTVTLQRIKFVKDWTARTQYMKNMMDAMLKRHGECLEHDIQNTLAIQAGQVQRKFRLEPEELNQLAGTAQRLQEIETRALMLTGDKLNHPQIMAGGQIEYASKGHDAPVMEVATMGSSGLSAAETAKLLAQWFDQAQPPKEEPIKVNGHATNGVSHGDELHAEEDQG